MNFAGNFRKYFRSSTRRADPPQTRERGWALVSVLWAVAILSMMAAATEALTVSSARIAHREFDAARVDADVRAGVVRAVLAVDDPRIGARWRLDGVPQAFSFDNLAMTINVQDEAGLIDLNAADETTIVGLFTAAGLAPDAAKTLGDNVSDWRTPIDADDPTRQQGTTDGQYNGRGYKPRHNPFQTVDELKLVTGMTPALFARVAPALTVYSREADVDESSAPLAVLKALYPNDPEKITQALNARTNPPPSTDPNAQPAGPPGVLPESGTAWGHSYLVTIAAAPNGHRILRSAVVEPTGDPDRPFLVEAWN
jgi:general secretion pathway protein K